jgi:uncharacterized protein YkwD
VARLSDAILVETNREREARGLQVLRADIRLAQAADRQLTFLRLIGGLRHDSPLPGRETVSARAKAAGVRSDAISENLALIPVRAFMYQRREGGGLEQIESDEPEIDVEQLAVLVVRGWMNSPGHRANLLNPKFTHLGCAVQTGVGPWSGAVAYSAQVFARL